MARPAFDLPDVESCPPADASEGSQAPGLQTDDAEEAFGDYLLDMRIRGKISSKDVCLLSWFAMKAGLNSEGGAVSRLAFRPGAPSGHYQRHLDSVTEMTSKLEDAYLADVPGFDAAHGGRCKLHMPFLPLHESLQAELEADPSIPTKFESVRSSDWAQTYHEHRLVLENPDDIVYPVALYLDGVNFAERDGVLAIFGYNLLTQVRHMVCSIRKSQTC